MRRRHGGSLFEICLRETLICDGGCRFLHLIIIILLSFTQELGFSQGSLLTLHKTTAGYLLGSPIFTSALLLAFVYTFAQDNRGQKAHFVILQIPVEFLPWAMLTLTLIMGGLPGALQQGTGIVAAHTYDFLTRLYPAFQGGRNYLQTPAAIQRLFGSEQATVTNKGFGTAIRPGQPAAQQGSTAWTSGRGQGRRLGGG